MNTTVLTTALLASTASIASASFVHQSNFFVNPSDPTGIHGIASDGSNFYLGSFNSGVSKRDGAFVESALFANPGSGQIRGVGYDASSGSLLVGNYSSGDVYRMGTDGSLMDTMSLFGASQMNAVGADGNTGNFFTLGFAGLIQYHMSDGTLISSFNAGTELTGLAVDDVNQSIFILTSTSDSVLEYDYNGTLIGTVIADATTTGGNGQGLYYDNTTAELYVTSQSGDIDIWADSTRPVVPAPSTAALLGLSGLIATRRRRSN